MNEKEQQMVLDNLGLIYVAFNQLNLKFRSEDEKQEYYDSGLIGLINGVKSFENNKGMKPSTFLVPCIKNEIKHLMVAKFRYKRFNRYGEDTSLNINTSGGDEIIDFVIDNRLSVEEQVERKIDLETIVYEIKKMKNINDALVLKMYFGLCGFTESTTNEISEKFQVSKQMIRTRINRGIENLKKEMRKYNE